MAEKETGLRVAIGIGSNLENPEAQVRDAIKVLVRQAWLREGEASPLYRTQPVGPFEQPDFYNAVVVGHTTLEEREVLEKLKEIESGAGRVRRSRWGPRVLDLDILLMGDLCVDSYELTIPHPELSKRAFVLVPLCALAPDWLHPLSGKRVQNMLSELTSSHSVVRVDE